MMNICPSCGEENIESARFCVSCGLTLPKALPIAEARKSNSRPPGVEEAETQVKASAAKHQPTMLGLPAPIKADKPKHVPQKTMLGVNMMEGEPTKMGTDAKATGPKLKNVPQKTMLGVSMSGDESTKTTTDEIQPNTLPLDDQPTVAADTIADIAAAKQTKKSALKTMLGVMPAKPAYNTSFGTSRPVIVTDTTPKKPRWFLWAAVFLALMLVPILALSLFKKKEQIQVVLEQDSTGKERLKFSFERTEGGLLKLWDKQVPIVQGVAMVEGPKDKLKAGVNDLHLAWNSDDGAKEADVKLSIDFRVNHRLNVDPPSMLMASSSPEIIYTIEVAPGATFASPGEQPKSTGPHTLEIVRKLESAPISRLQILQGTLKTKDGKSQEVRHSVQLEEVSIQRVSMPAMGAQALNWEIKAESAVKAYLFDSANPTVVQPFVREGQTLRSPLLAKNAEQHARITRVLVTEANKLPLLLAAPVFVHEDFTQMLVAAKRGTFGYAALAEQSKSLSDASTPSLTGPVRSFVGDVYHVDSKTFGRGIQVMMSECKEVRCPVWVNASRGFDEVRFDVGGKDRVRFYGMVGPGKTFVASDGTSQTVPSFELLQIEPVL